ncbi:hypothetical protein NDU88_002806 [Pleurodeles waltl]|uniref:Uncharacterized protein n=1 Tax=Pleurodeles waltl TaxID=8319 RepID=A0AAV7NF19_PLEWA|nr:hypothetical protein NDU88_002806 [Pleurodeles waltl]
MSAPRSGDARTRPRPPQLGLARLRAAPCPMRALVGPPAQAPARKGLALPWTRKRNSPLGRGGGGRTRPGAPKTTCDHAGSARPSRERPRFGDRKGRTEPKLRERVL